MPTNGDGARGARRLLPPVLCLMAAVMALGPAPATVRADDDVPLDRRVDAACDAGLLWLLQRQRADGTFERSRSNVLPGLDGEAVVGPWDTSVDAFAVHTLAACGVPADDPSLVSGFRAIRRQWDRRPRRTRRPEHDGADVRPLGEGVSTSFVSHCLLALDARNDGERPSPMLVADRAWAEELTDWLVEAQDPGAPARAATAAGKRARLRDDVPDPDAPPAPGDGGGFARAPWDATTLDPDLDSTALAVRGMSSAARLGVEVPRSAWTRVVRFLLARQAPDGPEVEPGAAASGDAPRARGWSYLGAARDLRVERDDGTASSAHRASAAMTARGVASLLLCDRALRGDRAYEPSLRGQVADGVRDGLAWIAHRSVLENVHDLDDPASHDDPIEAFDMLYALEQACVQSGAPDVDGVDWYAVGAERLLARQRKDGAFVSSSPDDTGLGVAEIDTCFALLFLRRAGGGPPQPAAASSGDE